MKVLGFEILKSARMNEINKRIGDLEDQQYDSRPGIDLLNTTSAGGVHIPYFQFQPRILYDIAFHSDVIRTCLLALKREMFRNGVEIRPKSLHEDEDTGSTVGDIAEKKLFLKFYDKANDNGQNLKTVFGQLEDDLNIIDDAFMFMNREYSYDAQGFIIGKRLKEILRMDPTFTRLIADKAGNMGRDEKSEPVFVCPIHRNQLIHSQICPKCERRTLPAHFRYDHGGANDTQMRYVYYAKGEVIHASKYSPTLLYGFAPVLTIWVKAETLFTQDKYMRDYYKRQRPPKGVFVVNTSNQASLKKAWEWILQKIRLDPHVIHPLAVESKDGKGMAQFIDFMSTLDEMQYTQAREDMRRTIGGLYGVMPIFQADMSASGGLNNEGLQITVTTRASESGQGIYNDTFIPAIIKELGIETWEVSLNPSEERDEVAVVDRKRKEIENAALMHTMGFDVKLKKDGDFEFSGEAKEPTETDPTADVGGLPDFSGNVQGMPSSVQKGKSKTIDLNEKLADEFSNVLDDELKKKLNKIDFTKGDNSEEVKAFMRDLSEKYGTEAKKKADQILKKLYKQELGLLSTQIGLKIAFDKVDNETIEALKQTQTYKEAFANLTQNTTERINKTISDILSKPKSFSVAKIEETLKEEFKLSQAQANTIARTETTKISNAARINSYTKFEKPTDKFNWLGSKRNRTQTCTNIVNRTKKGVSMAKLLEIIKEESAKEFPEFTVDPAAPAAHYNCKHVIVKQI